MIVKLLKYSSRGKSQNEVLPFPIQATADISSSYCRRFNMAVQKSWQFEFARIYLKFIRFKPCHECKIDGFQDIEVLRNNKENK